VAAAALGRNERPRPAAWLQEAADLLRATPAVAVRGIDEGHAGIQHRGERGDRVRLRHLAPRAADLPGAEADFRNVAPEPRRVSLFHVHAVGGLQGSV
jgi:hypothetical protein